MSTDLAVWEGPAPRSNAEALDTYELLYSRYVGSGKAVPPTERIAAYVGILLARYPDLTDLDDETVDDSPWADGPLIGNASGPLLYFAFVGNDAAEDAWTFAVEAARRAGLVCFDPQTGVVAT